MNSILENYHRDKNILNNTQIEKFPYLKIGNILATQIWKIYTQDRIDIIKKLFSILLCDKYKYEYFTKENASMVLLNASAGMRRNDNDLIMNNASSFMQPCGEINLYKCNILAISKVKYKFILSRKYYRELSCISDKFTRAFYAASLTLLDQLSADFDEKLNNIKLLVTFMDSDLFENYITQTVQYHGGKVAALQHGQRFYINKPCDSYVGMDNLTADYKLVWSKFSRQQYLNAGYSINRLPIVGCTKYLKTVKKANSNQGIVIFLDGPLAYGNTVSNQEMMNIVIDCCNEEGIKCLVKPHPIDNIEKYENGEGIELIDPKLQIDEISKEISFGIVHTSGVAIDLLILDTPVFVFEDGADFPIDLPQKYYFRNKKEFKDLVHEWVKNPVVMREEFENVRRNYVEADPRQLHRDFFSCFKGV